MSDPLYVVTETMEHGPVRIEVISDATAIGGVFEDICPALRAMAKEDSKEDRFLYAAAFENGRLTLRERLFGVFYSSEEQRHKFIPPTD